MIVSTAALPDYTQKVAMVDGGFDPLHDGHVEYFRAASELGVPVLCNISSDFYVSQKHPPLLSQQQRAEVIDAIRYISFTHLSQTSTEEVLQTLRPRFYVKGKDWEGKLPQVQREICQQHGIEIVYLDTAINSSSRLLDRLLERFERAGSAP